MSKAQSLIEQFYQEEQQRMAKEATYSPLEISTSSADMAIINTISKRFNKDKSLLVREALSQALLDMFSALDPVERKMLAKDADEVAQSIAAEIAEEQGLDSLEVTGNNWVQQDKLCIKAEKKAAKEEADRQAQMAGKVLGQEEAPIMEAEEIVSDSDEDDSETETETELLAEEETTQEVSAPEEQNTSSIFS